MAERACEEDKFSELPEDLLLKILGLVTTKEAVATMFLSKRWFSIWTMLPTLEYKDDEESKKSVWWFLEKSLQLHKAPVMYSFCMKLGPQCPTDVDVIKWVAKAIDRSVRVLIFKLLWSTDPTILPKSLFNSHTLVELTLSDNILVDVPSSSWLPSLITLELHSVVYKDEDSLLRFLSSCPVLELLTVLRKKDDNVKKFSVKVPSLCFFMYHCSLAYSGVGHILIIDTPRLEYLSIFDWSGGYCSVDDMPCIEHASFLVTTYPDDRLLRSLSSVLSFELYLNAETLVCCNAISFPRLLKLSIFPRKSDWSEPLKLLLGNAPKLKDLVVDYEYIYQPEYLPLPWNQSSFVPVCLLSHLEIFEFRGYGDNEEEEEFLTYILANAKCLKTVTISINPTIDLDEQKFIIKELENIPRISTASQLLFK